MQEYAIKFIFRYDNENSVSTARSSDEFTETVTRMGETMPIIC